MGNTIASSGKGKKKAKVMKLNGESFKLKTPISAMEIVKDYPGHVLLDSISVKRFGIRANPLELKEDLKPNKLYFLVELPKMQKKQITCCDVRMSAVDRLEFLMKSRRLSSISTELGSMKQRNSDDLQQVKVKMPRSQLEKITEDSKDGAELAHKVFDICLERRKFSCKNELL